MGNRWCDYFEHLKAFYCAFSKNNPEPPFAEKIGTRIDADLTVVSMERGDAFAALKDVVNLTDHPFSDFLSLPVTFLLKQIRNHLNEPGFIVECNGADDCFGFQELRNESKFRLKRSFPKILKSAVATAMGSKPHCYHRRRTHSKKEPRLSHTELAENTEKKNQNELLKIANPVNPVCSSDPELFEGGAGVRKNCLKSGITS